MTQLVEANTILQTEVKGLAGRLDGLRTENMGLENAAQGLARERDTRLALLRQENAVLGARLQRVQDTLDQIANAARLINAGEGAAPSAAPIGALRTNSPAPSSVARIHVVHDGDSLMRISLLYYGTTGRWQDIYAANRAVFQDENALIPGQRLTIP